jgi:hypothetical protein
VTAVTTHVKNELSASVPMDLLIAGDYTTIAQISEELLLK